MIDENYGIRELEITAANPANILDNGNPWQASGFQRETMRASRAGYRRARRILSYHSGVVVDVLMSKKYDSNQRNS